MFERGFKAWCEKYAAKTRAELGLKVCAPLDAQELAKHLGIRVWKAEQVPGISADQLAVLLRNDGKTPSCWSALTIVFGAKVVVVLNSSHSAGRQASDLMHELAHRILDHKTHEMNISPEGIMLLKDYDKAQEMQADWLSGCLLLPREALISIRAQRLDASSAASAYGVSQKMMTYRMAMTGISRQFA